MSAFRPPSTWLSRPSPNHSARPPRTRISGIVLHCDASSNVASSLDWCRRPESRVSYHVLIGRKGEIYSLVAPERKAWHAGVSTWDGVPHCNNYTIGVSMSNKNDGVEAYPLPQVQAAAAVCAALCQHFQIPASRITSHALIATPKGRKTEPKHFDMDAFRKMVADRLPENHPK